LEKVMKKIGWDIPVFPEEEGKRRHGQIRQAMEKQGLDCLIVAGVQGNYGDKAGSFRYVSNYVPWFDDEYVLFPKKGESVLLAWSVPHAEWCRKISWIKEVDPIVSMSIGPARKLAYTNRMADHLRSFGYSQARIGICDFETMPVYVFQGLREALPKAELVDARSLLSLLRMMKSPAEIEFMQKSAECADRGFQAMRETSRPGVSETIVWANCERAMTVAGATPPSFTLMASTPSLEEKGLGQPYAGTGRVLKEGDIITNEISASYGGYWTQLCGPIVLGRPIPKDLARVNDIHQEMYQLALSEIRPGVRLGDIEVKLRDLARSRGADPSPAWALAHIGLQIRDDIPLETVLQPNMTLVNHPYTHYGNGTYGGHTIGATVVVTPEGCRVLNRTAMEIHVVDV
jgi:Xaa-Pro aminopeptidase